MTITSPPLIRVATLVIAFEYLSENPLPNRKTVQSIVAFGTRNLDILQAFMKEAKRASINRKSDNNSTNFERHFKNFSILHIDNHNSILQTNVELFQF
jgi:hypothetical protein